MRLKQFTVWKKRKEILRGIPLYPHPVLHRTLFIFKSAEAKRIIKSGLYRRLRRNCATIVRFHKYQVGQTMIG